jgi:DNA-binding response OmpR family regulator
MGRDHAPDDRQAQTCARRTSRARRICSREAFESSVEEVRREARAVIGGLDHHLLGEAGDGQPQGLRAGGGAVGARSVRRGEVDIRLSPKELLRELMRRPDEVLSRSHLIDHVWDFAYTGGSNVVDVYIRSLRDKIDRPFARDTIQTVRGVGYRIESGA